MSEPTDFMIPRVAEDLGVVRSRNMWALAKGLYELYLTLDGAPEQFGKPHFFNMRAYNRVEPNASHCGTVRCAAGFGPILGILKTRHKGEIIDYTSYVEVVLCGEGVCWWWVFLGSWALVDNTILGAAQRIAYYLCVAGPEWQRVSGISDIRESDLATQIAVNHLVNEIPDVKQSQMVAPGSPFDQWKSMFDWRVTPDIPGAVKAAAASVKKAQAWEASYLKWVGGQ